MLARLENISLFYPDKTVLENVSLTVYPGDSIVLFGENGSGKTSLFRILMRDLKPNSGPLWKRTVRASKLHWSPSVP